MATVVIQLKNKVYDENFQKFKRGIYDELLYRHHPVSTVTEMWPYLLHLSFFYNYFFLLKSFKENPRLSFHPSLPQYISLKNRNMLYYMTTMPLTHLEKSLFDKAETQGRQGRGWGCKMNGSIVLRAVLVQGWPWEWLPSSSLHPEAPGLLHPRIVSGIWYSVHNHISPLVSKTFFIVCLFKLGSKEEPVPPLCGSLSRPLI